MEQHLSILLVVIPLLAAPITAILPRARIAWLLTLLITWSCLLLAVWQLQSVLDGNIISYELGGWAPPWGIEYRIDTLNAFIAMIVAAMAAVTLPYALRSVEQEIAPRHIPLFYTAFLLCLTGLLGITQTGDIFNLFVFLEISSLSSYALISMGRQRQALTAAFQYLVMGTIGATFLLIGIGLIYSETGTLNMLDLGARLPAVFELRTVHTAFAFIMIGVALKLALFPLHLWLPNAYTYAPTVITIFLAATATKVAIYVMLRMVYTVFSIGFAEDTPLNEMFMLLGVIGVLIASFAAIYQTNSKRLLAYSSVAQIGYMVLGIGFGSVLGLTATVVHIFNHALIKAALFMAVGALIYQVGSSRLQDWHGLGRKMPWTFAALVIAGLSLIGLPGTAGFISKWYLVSAAVEQHNWLIAFIILIGSLMAVAYIWKMVEVLFFREADANVVTRQEAPLLLLLPTWFLVLANLYFGFHTELTVDIARNAAVMLEQMTP
ncbi:MAG: monovalent cation/H+ antiporter subunit D family protein [Halobacteria archaeon]|nr:monovalent cation/H+ antiporter subunit D family protein [Halobacteria archaeon]